MILRRKSIARNARRALLLACAREIYIYINLKTLLKHFYSSKLGLFRSKVHRF